MFYLKINSYLGFNIKKNFFKNSTHVYHKYIET